MLDVIFRSLIAVTLISSGSALGQEDLAYQIMNSDEVQFARIFPNVKQQSEQVIPVLVAEFERRLPPDANERVRERLAIRQANAAIVLLKFNQAEKVWPLLKHTPDPSTRSFLIHRLALLDADHQIIIDRLDVELDITIRRALILSLGGFDEQALSQENQKRVLSKLQEAYRTDPDPGLHSAAEWLLRKWKHGDWLKKVNEEWAKDAEQRTAKWDGIRQQFSQDKEKPLPQWYVNSQHQTMVVIPAPVEFLMGSPKAEVGRLDDERQHQRRIDRSFAMASTEVTVNQFLRFRKDYDYFKPISPTGESPVNNITWYDAVAYCNWLSEQEGLPREQWCYVPNKEGKYEAGMTVAPNSSQRSGYRLPTEAEWEYSCRAGANTRYSFGESDDLLAKYAWYGGSSSFNPFDDVRSDESSTLKPNDFGFFDMHGNSWERCQDAYGAYGDEKESLEREGKPALSDFDVRVMRGGSFNSDYRPVRSACRGEIRLSNRFKNVGFRLARTLPPVTSTSSHD